MTATPAKSRPYSRNSSGSRVTCPRSGATIDLLGGVRHANVTLTNDEVTHLAKLYGYDLDGCQNPLERAGALRNLFRHAEMDGLRVLAWMAKRLEPDEDPVKFVASLFSEAGYDTQGDEYGPEDEEGEPDPDPELCAA